MVKSQEVFVERRAGLDASKLVFLDEAAVSVAGSRRVGWAPCGATSVIQRPASGRRLHRIGAIALDGVLVALHGRRVAIRFGVTLTVLAALVGQILHPIHQH